MEPLHKTYLLKSPELPPLIQSPRVHYSTMLKDKLKLPDKARRVFPDRLGSLVSGFNDKEEENEDSASETEVGKELEILLPNASGSGEASEDDYVEKIEEQRLSGIRQRPEKEGTGLVSVKEVIAADDKRSDLEYELSQMEINLEKLQRIADTGLPEGGGLRATVWKLLLGYLPPSRDLWEKELSENRQKYSKLKQELLLSPSQFTRIKDESLKSNEQSADNDGDGLLRRHEISQEDHPLSLGKASVWNQYFEHTEISEQIDRDLQRTHPDMKFFSGETSFSRKTREAMRNILLLFSKLNPAIRYVQGMNEVLAPLYYVFSTDPDEQNAVNAEADSFCCFVRLLSDSVDHFCQQLDNSAVGILSTLSRLSELLKANNEELWHHLEVTNKVKPQFYAFRWITLLLTQEFNFQSILRIWDSFLSNPFGVQDMLLRVCCAMLLCIRSRLLSGDFAANLKLLQHYPEINIEYLLQVARDLSPDTSSYRLSL
ncbi:TBC domain-containing protein C1952.17c-like isoform X1 [Pistacia vera]|uniref:TBC domain-containing protein C1952.17c-like isoform X1 n=1 Tax=Pistacia vera TaxID=55513 RepID=UPI0012637CDC|nr:TBC domain-containing protein C1952.17c-like isoform X1 [Pistacia vera]